MVKSSLDLLVCLLVALCSAVPVQALPPPSATGVSISPFLQQIDIQPTDSQKSFTVTLSNHTSVVQELDLKGQDFGSLNDTGGVLLEGSNTYTQKYGLASWLSLEKDAVVLEPGTSASLLATVDNRESLQPGGHYGAIVATVSSLDTQHGNKVLVNQQLLSLVLVNKVGGEHYDLKLSSIEQNGNWLHLPNDVRLRFQNPGNVHVVPRGVVRLKSPSGTVLAQGIINTESAYILPETFRQLYVPLTPVNRALPLPGVYQLEVSYRYDGLNRTVLKHQAVRYISLPMYFLLAVLILFIWLSRKRLKKLFKIARSTK